MNKLKSIAACMAMAFIAVTLHAQSNTTPDPMDVMRSNGKIYVVVAVVLTILLGMFVYLISLDRKISKLEKK